jgi:glycosyltransferase involved in cell wall biosynthesis
VTTDEILLRTRPAPPAAETPAPPDLPRRREAAPPAPVRPASASVSFVMPCHNEARNLEILLPLLVGRATKLARRWEIVLVDDGSTDDTAAVLRRWSEHPGVRAVVLSRNFGKEAALTCGLQHASGDVVISMDADLQHPPRMVDEMLARWQAGADVVFAVKANRDDEGALRRWGARAFYRLLNAFERYKVPPDGGDFRLMDRAVVDALLALPERNRFMKGLYAWVGFQAESIAYVPEERHHGSSNFSLPQLLNLSLDGLTSFTTWPLRVATVCGVLVALSAIAYGIYQAMVYFLWGNPVSGWTTIVVGLTVLLGMQMILLGIMGEYIGRIFEEVKGRPIYVVKDVQGQGLKARAE